MWQSFYMHAVKKLAINLAVAWEGIGIGLILVGAIPVLSAWCYQVGEGTAVAMFLVGAVAVWSGYELSIQLSLIHIFDHRIDGIALHLREHCSQHTKSCRICHIIANNSKNGSRCEVLSPD